MKNERMLLNSLLGERSLFRFAEDVLGHLLSDNPQDRP